MLTPADEAYLAASCARSGVPVKISDPAVLADLAALLRPGAVRVVVDDSRTQAAATTNTEEASR